ncbi:MAG: class I SAM-dependent methyltransferase [Solirubrobacteraceae bacterium]
MTAGLYERLARSYSEARQADPRIAELVDAALGDARSVVNVGAGTGSYEPMDRLVVAVEPAAAMRAQRPPGAAPCLAASAEELPFDDAGVDAALAVYTDFHWHDRARGIAEMVRISRRRVVVLTVDAASAARYWLIRDYFPRGLELFAPLRELIAMLPGPTRITAVPIPHDCRDGFVQAFWRCPEALLDPDLRASMALFARIPANEVEVGIERLRADLAGGRWERRNRRLLELDAADLGHRLVIWARPSARRRPALPARPIQRGQRRRIR